jgi:CRISPR type I-E-associated protein CasA/Cse1
MADCSSYVEERSAFWDLFDERRPFGQVVSFEGKDNPAHLLTYQAARKNNPVHLDHRLEHDSRPVAFDALARGMLTLNAFAGSSGGGYRSGPLAMRSLGLLVGDNLQKTLLLNLLKGSGPTNFDWEAYGALRTATSAKLNLAERYLWTSRRVWLVPDADGAVRRMILAPGNEMSDDERTLDPMVITRLDSQGKKHVPLRVEASRALWRSAHLFLNCRAEDPSLDSVKQLRSLLERDFVPVSESISLRMLAVGGDAQGPSTELWRDEQLPFALSVVSDDERYEQLRAAVESADDRASKTRKRILSFAFRYLEGRGGAKTDKRDAISLAEELSPDLMPFWQSLAPSGEQIACNDFNESNWTTLLSEAANRTFKEAVSGLPADARRFRAEYVRQGAESKEVGGKSK